MRRLIAAILIAGIGAASCAAQRQMHNSHPYHPPAPAVQRDARHPASAPKAVPARAVVTAPAPQSPKRK